jgi:RNA polymerase sigma factor (sigma-70 family)
MSVSSPEAENRVVSPAMSDSWRTWLLSGIRREPIDRRRVRGAHKGLKRMLVEGTSDGTEVPDSWKRFSGAMVRQSVDEAVSSLPSKQRQLIKLAYFGGLTNGEIADGLGVSISSVERGLRQAIDRVSDYVQRGKGIGRKAIYAIGLFSAGRQVLKTGVIIVATAAAGAVISMQPVSPAPLTPVERATVPAVTSVQPYAPLQHRVVDVAQTTNAIVVEAASQSVTVGGLRVTPPEIDLPAVTLPIPVTLPPLPLPPIRHGPLGA